MTIGERLTSRKFIVTMTAMFLATALAILEKFDANVGLVFGAAIAAYNWANVQGAKNGR